MKSSRMMTLTAVVAAVLKLQVCAAGAQVDDLSLSQSETQITVERIYDGCIDCPDHRLILRRSKGRQFDSASVTYIDTRTKRERHGNLDPYYYNNLLKLIEGQGYFGMADEYAMGWHDSLIVAVSVTVGSRSKSVRTRNEGEVPVELWGILMAVDGVAAKTKWKER